MDVQSKTSGLSFRCIKMFLAEPSGAPCLRKQTLNNTDGWTQVKNMCERDELNTNDEMKQKQNQTAKIENNFSF